MPSGVPSLILSAVMPLCVSCSEKSVRVMRLSSECCDNHFAVLPFVLLHVAFFVPAGGFSFSDGFTLCS
jgi:hypothetical protein